MSKCRVKEEDIRLECTKKKSYGRVDVELASGFKESGQRYENVLTMLFADQESS